MIVYNFKLRVTLANGKVDSSKLSFPIEAIKRKQKLSEPTYQNSEKSQRSITTK
jgi:hypothetical protein